MNSCADWPHAVTPRARSARWKKPKRWMGPTTPGMHSPTARSMSPSRQRRCRGMRTIPYPLPGVGRGPRNDSRTTAFAETLKSCCSTPLNPSSGESEGCTTIGLRARRDPLTNSHFLTPCAPPGCAHLHPHRTLSDFRALYQTLSLLLFSNGPRGQREQRLERYSPFRQVMGQSDPRQLSINLVVLVSEKVAVRYRQCSLNVGGRQHTHP